MENLQTAAPQKLGQLMELGYSELKRVARHRLRSERNNHTLSTTGLVNEAYLRLHNQDSIGNLDHREFMVFASECMRRILVDYARAHMADKRGRGVPAEPLDESRLMTDDEAAEITEVSDAVERLQAAFPRGCDVIRCRLFGGLSLEETGTALGVSKKTVQRDWTAAIAWLRKEVGTRTLLQ